MKREVVFDKDRDGGIVALTNPHDVLGMWLQTIGAGRWVLRLEKKASQRTISQNALMWVWFDAIAKEWSDATDRYYSRDSVKEFFCRRYMPMEMPDGSVVGGSTSGLTTEQMTEFMNKIQAYAATEWGITLLGAEDSMFNEWRSQYE